MINTNGYITPDGTMVTESEKLTEAQQTLLEQYQSLAYCNLFSRFEEIEQSFFRLSSH